MMTLTSLLTALNLYNLIVEQFPVKLIEDEFKKHVDKDFAEWFLDNTYEVSEEIIPRMKRGIELKGYFGDMTFPVRYNTDNDTWNIDVFMWGEDEEEYNYSISVVPDRIAPYEEGEEMVNYLPLDERVYDHCTIDLSELPLVEFDEIPDCPYSFTVTGHFKDGSTAPMYYDYEAEQWDVADDSPKYEELSVSNLIGWSRQ